MLPPYLSRCTIVCAGRGAFQAAETGIQGTSVCVLTPAILIPGVALGVSDMPRLRNAGAAACLLAIALSGCSQTELPARDFVLAEQRSEKAVEQGNTLESAKLACKAETEKRGIASVMNIFSRFRKGSAEEDFIACMRQRGYEMPS